MKIIRLSKGQTKWTAVNNPVFQHKRVRTDEENESIVQAFAILKTPQLREELLFSNLHLIEHTVGRYLANWPETKRWKDDMVSVGVETLLKKIDKIGPKTKAKWFRAQVVIILKRDIEIYLNNARTSVAASLRTNYRRVQDGKPLASVPEISLDKLLERE